MGELAAEIARIAATQSFTDRDALLSAARSIVAKSGARASAELCWAVLCVVAELQARQPPTRRVTWRPSMIRRQPSRYA
jgi:hypothetical protein